MNHFERVAIYTLIENLEKQLLGLKTLISAAGNVPSPHKVTQIHDPVESHELTDEEEQSLSDELERSRKLSIEKMSKIAETEFQQAWATELDG